MSLLRQSARAEFLLNRLPELCGLAWLALLAGAIWMHTHVSLQPPIYDAFTYYLKADNFWTAVHAGHWFNPLNVPDPFRPPGTILMSYPFGFSINPRPFYFRSIYFPVFLLFVAVGIATYDRRSDRGARWRVVLTAMLFGSMTLAYHFEFGSAGGGGNWGLVDSFLAGLAAVAGACAWRGTNRSANHLAWAIATCVFSVIAMLVKPSGVIVAAIAGFAWVAFGLATLTEVRRSGWQQGDGRRLAFALALGAVLIALGDAVVLQICLDSDYLSSQSFAQGNTAIALMRLMPIPLSWLWPMLNSAVGRGLIYWAALAVLICAVAIRSVLTARNIAAVFFCIGTIIFGVWFWFIGSGAPTQVRYPVPFFMMGLVWMTPVIQRIWGNVPVVLRLVTTLLMIAVALNTTLILLVPRPALAWQQFSGEGITADFPPNVLSAFKQFVAAPATQPRSVYVFSFDVSDGILDAVIDESRLLHPERQALSLRRPIDWQRSATIRLHEVETANALMVNPQQCAWAPTGQTVTSLAEEQGVFTCWADGLTAADGVTVFLAAPTARLLVVADPAKLKESLQRMVAAYKWDPTFVTANFGPNAG